MEPFLYLIEYLVNTKLAPDKLIENPSAPVFSVYNKYGNLLKVLSDKVGIELATAVAIICVESSGEGFVKDKLLIRFENHLFYTYWGKNSHWLFNKHFRFDPFKHWKNHKFSKDSVNFENFHGIQEKEHEVFEFAKTLDENAALYSISMGLPQILGSNHEVIGYKTPKEMYDNFSKDIKYHIFGLFDFFSPAMLNALKKKDFVKFVSLYNGPGQVGTYEGILKSHYNKFNSYKL